MTLYDYLKKCNGKKSTDIATCVITDKQSIFVVKNREDYDHWDIVKELHSLAFLTKEIVDDEIFDDAVMLFSEGIDLIVSIPDKLTSDQVDELNRYLEQAKRFEEEYGITLHMPLTRKDISDICRNRITNDRKLNDKELIIGKVLKKSRGKYE